jgi:hypothetical protein
MAVVDVVIGGHVRGEVFRSRELLFVGEMVLFAPEVDQFYG